MTHTGLYSYMCTVCTSYEYGEHTSLEWTKNSGVGGKVSILGVQVLVPRNRHTIHFKYTYMSDFTCTKSDVGSKGNRVIHYTRCLSMSINSERKESMESELLLL